MIQAWRLLPWFRERLAHAPHTVSVPFDCDRCRATKPRKERQQLMSCGFEQPIAKAHRWTHPGWNAKAFGEPAMCIGYMARLPPVREVDELAIHWERNSLAQVLGGNVPEIVLEGLAEMDWHAKAAEGWHYEQERRELEAKRGRK